MKVIFNSYNKVMLLLISSVSCIQINAQQASNNNAVAASIPKGIFIYLGNHIPKQGYYQIEKEIVGEKKFTAIGKVTVPQNEQELKNRQTQFSPLIENIDPLNDNDIHRIWNYINSNSTTDTLHSANLPMMHQLAGTGFIDDKVEKENSYQYRVSLYNASGDLIKTTETNIVRWPATPSLEKPILKEKSVTGSHVYLEWFVEHQGNLSHFNIYRSIFGKNDFKKITPERGFNANKDSIFLVAIDSIGEQASLYEYYAVPADIYGNLGPASDAVPAGTVAQNYVPPVLILKARSLETNHQVRLNWNYDQKSYIRSITIMRSADYDSGYRRIANVPPTDTSYTDIIPQADENYYYYLVIDGPVNNGLRTAKVSVLFSGNKEKPTPPSEIAAQTIKGGVQLYWQCNEPYLKGFYVYRSASTETGFLQISGLVPAGKEIYSFTDTSGTLQGEKVYDYTVKSVNDNDQLSDFSDTVNAVPGISMSLAAPLHLRYKIENGKIELAWDDMRNTEANLLGYKIYRKLSTEKVYHLLPSDTTNAEQNYFTDSTMETGIAYNYAVSSLDYFGNESAPSYPVNILVKANIPSPPAGLHAGNDQNGVLLSWGELVGDDLLSVKIYRSAPGTTSKLIGTTDISEQTFLDKTAEKGKLYFYQLSSVNKQKQESDKSEKVSIRY